MTSSVRDLDSNAFPAVSEESRHHEEGKESMALSLIAKMNL
jgi:hypothetical protein